MHLAPKGTVVLFVVILAAAGGCGAKDPHGRLPIVGSVTFQGQPLDSGVIEFMPSDPNQKFSARSLILNGKYRIPQEQGLPPGTYRVLVTSPDPDKPEGPVGAPGTKMPPLGQERIPAQYNRDSRETVEVKADIKNSFDFTIK